MALWDAPFIDMKEPSARMLKDHKHIESGKSR